MDMKEWARKEVELACKEERPEGKEIEWDYGCACYNSALKAYENLLDDEHSGFSWGLTKAVLDRLMDNLPLTPITEEDFIGFTPEILDSPEYLKERGLKSTVQCPRMSSLFRDEYLDGTVKYHDVRRYYCKDVNDESTYTFGRFSEILDELYPITLPYYPTTNKYIMYTELLGNKDIEIESIQGIKTPEGNLEPIYKYFKEVPVEEVHETVESMDGDEREVSYWKTKVIEITVDEYEDIKEKLKSETI